MFNGCARPGFFLVPGLLGLGACLLARHFHPALLPTGDFLCGFLEGLFGGLALGGAWMLFRRRMARRA